MKYFLTIILTLLVLFILIFVFQNTDIVVLKFLAYNTQVFSGIIILASVFLGLVLSTTILLPILLIKMSEIRDLKLEIVKLKEKLKNETIQYESDGLGSEGMDYKEKKG
ncbi:LapA family protein [Candidatus Gracilibacteria bacterium]|nr:LapA family protein [Candidatus Gracilibacteria bacterium]